MRKQIARKIVGFFVGTFAIIAAIWGAHQSAQQSLLFPAESQINDVENVGDALSSRERQTIIRSRASTVRVFSLDLADGGMSTLTGTYLTYDDKYFVLTASHGVYDFCGFTNIVVNEILYPCTQYVLRDPVTDYIVIQVDEIKTLTPVDVASHTPRRSEWLKELAVQNTVFYTGYPNDGGPYTFEGRVVGFQEENAIFIDSYGWSGSSGAGVFSRSGNLIGWVMALEVGETYFGREVLENFIWVIPLFKIDWIAVGEFVD
jgi:hypothetical protein